MIILQYGLIYYFTFSLITFFVYWKDKRASMKGNWRTPEKTLHLLALLGGWPGGLLAQRVFRHKTRKFKFQFVFWLSVIVNCVGTILILNPDLYM